MRAYIGTRKGLFRLDARRDGWRIEGPWFLGVPVQNTLHDPRDGSLWVLLGHGHWGPKLHVSTDGGATFEERPCPAIPDGYGQATVQALNTIVPADAPGSYHVGAAPGALFTTRDAGATWTIDDALWQRRQDDGWFASGGGIMLHSIAVAPDPARIHIAVSSGGVYETRDGGRSWTPRNHGVRADFLPEPFPEVGQDPHLLLRHRRDPELLWQQNHCGNYRSTDGGATWTALDAGGAGFAMALDDENPAVAWTIPMDSDERRVARDGALAVCRTDDGGTTWRDLRSGLPQEHCYDIVFRHGFAVAGDTLVFGTTCGRVFASRDRGDGWALAAPYLPPINSVTVAPPTK